MIVYVNLMIKKFLFNTILKWARKFFSNEIKSSLHMYSVKSQEEYYAKETPLTDYFNQENYFKIDNYKLLDAGCSGGISFYWNRIKDLGVLGIDLAEEEIKRLNDIKQRDSEKYIYAQIINKNKIQTKFDNYRNQIPEYEEIGFDDTGAKRIQDIFDKFSVKTKILTKDTRQDHLLKNVEKKTLKEICEENNFNKINFVDIDLDGNSLLGLASLENLLENPELFGIKIEIVFPEKTSGDYFLSICEIMHDYNYSLVKVLPRAYGSYELPNQFSYGFPAQSIKGFHHQGDLIYIKTINKESLKKINKTNFCKFLTTLEMMDLQGLAIKLLNIDNNKFFNNEIKEKFKNLLTVAPSKDNFGEILSYKEYVKKITEDPYTLMKYDRRN